MPSRFAFRSTTWAVISISTPTSCDQRRGDGKTDLRMTTGSVVVIVKRTPLLITFTDSAGNVLLADEPSLPMAEWHIHPLLEAHTLQKSLPALATNPVP